MSRYIAFFVMGALASTVSAQVHADDFTLSVDVTETNGGLFTIDGGDTLTVVDGVSVATTGADQPGLAATGVDNTLRLGSILSSLGLSGIGGVGLEPAEPVLIRTEGANSRGVQIENVFDVTPTPGLSQVVSYATIETLGPAATAIYVRNPSGDILQYGEIDATGDRSHGLHIDADRGDASIENFGGITVRGDDARGILGQSFTGEVYVRNEGGGRILTYGARSHGIDAFNFFGGAVEVENAGGVTTTGDSSVGIRVYNFPAASDPYVPSGTGSVVNDGFVRTNGEGSHGIDVEAFESATVINRGEIVTGYLIPVFDALGSDPPESFGDGASAIRTQAGSGDARTENYGDLTIWGDDVFGIDTFSFGGNATLLNEGNVTMRGEGLAALRAFIVDGDSTATITNSGILAAPIDGAGIDIFAVDGDGVVTNSGSISLISGGSGITVSAPGGQGMVSNTGNIRDPSAFQGIGGGGFIAVDPSEWGISISAESALLQNRGVIDITGFAGMSAWGAEGANVVNYGDITVQEGAGIFATAGSGASGILNYADIITLGGDSAIGLDSFTSLGDSSIISFGDSIRTTGIYSYGISSYTIAGSSTVTNSANVVTSGDESDAIYAWTDSGRASLSNTGDVTTSGFFSPALGVYAWENCDPSPCPSASEGSLTNRGTVRTLGDESVGLVMDSDGAARVVNSGRVVTVGTESHGATLRGIAPILENYGRISALGPDSHAVVFEGTDATLHVHPGSEIGGVVHFSDPSSATVGYMSDATGIVRTTSEYTGAHFSERGVSFAIGESVYGFAPGGAVRAIGASQRLSGQALGGMVGRVFGSPEMLRAMAGIRGAPGGIGSGLAGALGGIGSGVRGGLGGPGTGIGVGGGAIGSGVRSGVGSVGAAVDVGVDATGSGVRDGVESLGGGIGGVLGAVGAGLRGLFFGEPPTRLDYSAASLAGMSSSDPVTPPQPYLVVPFSTLVYDQGSDTSGAFVSQSHGFAVGTSVNETQSVFFGPMIGASDPTIDEDFSTTSLGFFAGIAGYSGSLQYALSGGLSQNLVSRRMYDNALPDGFEDVSTRYFSAFVVPSVQVSGSLGPVEVSASLGQMHNWDEAHEFAFSGAPMTFDSAYSVTTFATAEMGVPLGDAGAFRLGADLRRTVGEDVESSLAGFDATTANPSNGTSTRLFLGFDGVPGSIEVGYASDGQVDASVSVSIAF